MIVDRQVPRSLGFADDVGAKIRSGQAGMQIAELVRIGELSAFTHRALIAESPSHAQAAVDRLLDEYREWMGQADDERRAGPQHAVDLTKYSIEIVDRGESENTHHEIYRCIAQEREIRGVALVQLDLDGLAISELARVVDLRRVGVEREYFGALFGECNCRMAHAAAEIDDPLAGDVADQATIEAGHVGPEFDVIDRAGLRCGECSGVAHPSHASRLRRSDKHGGDVRIEARRYPGRHPPLPLRR